MQSQTRKTRVALLSITSNSVLVALKIVVGMAIGSVSVISEAIHSGVDLVASVIAWAAVRRSSRPADERYRFGHGKIENISGTVEALLIFLAAGWIIFEAIHKLLHPQRMEAAGWGVAVMLVSALVNLAISAQLFRVGKDTDSIALQADAWHLRTDVYTSAGVMGGLAAMLLAERAFPGANLHWMDPLAAIAVALLIIRAAYQLTVRSTRDLLDASLPPDEEAWILDYVGRLTPTIRGFHNLRTRKGGSRRFIEFHLAVEADMSVEDSHRICDVMGCDIEDHFPDSSVTIHVEPCDGLCLDECMAGCMVSEDDRRAVREGRL